MLRRIDGRLTLAEIGRQVDSFLIRLDSGQRRRIHVVKGDKDIAEYVRRDALAFSKWKEPGIEREFLERIVDHAGIALKIVDDRGNMISGSTLIDQPVGDSGIRFVDPRRFTLREGGLPYQTHYVEGAFALSPDQQTMLGDVVSDFASRGPRRNTQLLMLRARRELSRLAGAHFQVVSFAERNWRTSHNLAMEQFYAFGRTGRHFTAREGAIRYLARRNLDETHEWNLLNGFRRVSHYRDLYQSMRDYVPAFVSIPVAGSVNYPEIAEVMSDAFFEGWRGLFSPQCLFQPREGSASIDVIGADEQGVLFVPPDPQLLQRTPITDSPLLKGVYEKGPESLV